jgi:hypothetical protein
MTQNPHNLSIWTRVWIPVAVALFVLVLILSAILVPELRVLHSLQALIYVAVFLLTRNNSPWGFGIGVIIAIAWNSLSLFITHLFQVGAGQAWSLVHTGHASDLVPMLVFFGGLAHFLLILACIAGFLHLRPGIKQWGQFFAGGILSLGYFILIASASGPH